MTCEVDFEIGLSYIFMFLLAITRAYVCVCVLQLACFREQKRYAVPLKE